MFFLFVIIIIYGTRIFQERLFSTISEVDVNRICFASIKQSHVWEHCKTTTTTTKKVVALVKHLLNSVNLDFFCFVHSFVYSNKIKFIFNDSRKTINICHFFRSFFAGHGRQCYNIGQTGWFYFTILTFKSICFFDTVMNQICDKNMSHTAEIRLETNFSWTVFPQISGKNYGPLSDVIRSIFFSTHFCSISKTQSHLCMQQLNCMWLFFYPMVIMCQMPWLRSSKNDDN